MQDKFRQAEVRRHRPRGRATRDDARLRADESTSIGSTLTPRDYSYEYDDASNLTKETVDGQSKS